MKLLKRVSDHPIVFTIGCMIALFVLMFVVSLVPLPFKGVEAELLTTVLPTLILAWIVKLLIGENFRIGFTKEKLAESICFCMPVLFISFVTFIGTLLAGGKIASTMPAIITALITAVTAGVFEEVFFRGIICNNMMRAWKNQKIGIILSVIISAVCFGVTHLMNAVIAGFSIGLFLQIFFATVFGIFIGAIYVRTRNIWGVIIAHFLWDFLIMVFSTGQNGSEMIAENLSNITLISVIPDMILAVICITGTLYLLRKEKHREIVNNWA